MAESYEGMASLDEIQVNEEHWGPGSAPIVKAWLRENYDPDTMPKLQIATIQGKKGVWLLGWAHQDTDYLPLLELIFGEPYARAQLDQVDAYLADQKGGRLCPRCGVNGYTPYTRKWEIGDPPPPALSRTDNKTYVCSNCGSEEAMEDHFKGKLTPQSEWPIIKPGTFGLGKP